MKYRLLILVMTMLPLSASAQETQTDYNFLRLPISAHAAALGGDNITIIEDDPTLVFNNPALISSVSDNSLNLNFMSYMKGTKTASASFVKAIKERSTIAVSAEYMDYGNIPEVDENNVQSGTFSAKDIAIGGTYAYALTNTIVGGVTAKMISSSIAGYNSFAMGVDLGINYYNDSTGWSVSAVAKNLGGQLKAYNDDYESMPFDLQIGVSKKIYRAPFRLSATMTNLTHWNTSFINHLVFGVDFLISNNMYLAAGYNPKRSKEMDINDGGSHGAGWSFGGGLQLEKFKLQIAYAKYHVSANSLLINLTYSL